MQRVPTVVAHARTRPKRNAFRYRLCYFAISMHEWQRGTRGLFLSIDKFNLFSLRSKDYGDGRTPPAKWIDSLLTTNGLADAADEVVLLTLPRLLGYAFNPVSFWFCLDREKRLRAVLAEVNNTFGERHCYLCFHETHEPITGASRLVVRKIFHVSPFMEVKGSYRFRFDYDADRIGVQIDLMDEEGVILATSMRGKPRTATASGLVQTAILYPFQTIKVVALIHYQAVKLFLKGVQNYRKPDPPEAFVSH
ncbi:MAG TPA: DUF1365 domain-containing protein [Rhizomicrobium sp.]|nr:DUF1365 domain-containing protein [Rhizomicrobium sp.]